MDPHEASDTRTFTLSAPPLTELPEPTESLLTLATALLWLALSTIGMGLIGGVLINA